MAFFIDLQAKDGNIGALSEDGSSSEGELSDEIPLMSVKHPRRRGRLLSSESDEGDQVHNTPKTKKGRLDKENRKPQSKRGRSRSPSSESAQILSELKKTNKIMMHLTKKMKKHESRLTVIENKLSESASSSSSLSATPKRSSKKEVPVEVRVSILFVLVVELIQWRYHDKLKTLFR